MHIIAEESVRVVGVDSEIVTQAAEDPPVNQGEPTTTGLSHGTASHSLNWTD